MDITLNIRAEDLIRRGFLPGIVASEVWSRHGDGECCTLCNRTISSADILYEVEVSIRGRPRLYQFHILCHTAWQDSARNVRQSDIRT